MEGSFFDDLRQFEFFGGDQKPVRFSTNTQAPVVNGSPLYSGNHLSKGIYQDEESIDLTSFLEVYNTTEPSASPPGTVFSQQQATFSPGLDLVSSTLSPEAVFSVPNYCPQNSSIISTVNAQAMYGHSGNENGLSNAERAPSTVSSTSIMSVGQEDSLIGMKPAPGKAQKNSKKRTLLKGTEEWRQKRDRNNDAVRKSREKSKKRIQETEHRVTELEDENRQLQSKITLLSKELNVLKSLFSSAGVAQPAEEKELSACLR